MEKYVNLLMMLIGITLGGIISYFIFGLITTLKVILVLYFIIVIVLVIELYLESREEKTEE